MNTPDTIRGIFAQQAQQSANLGSPFMARMLTLLTQRLTHDTAVGARVLGWQGQASLKDDALALRLAAGFHALVLSGQDEGLLAAYPPEQVSDAQLWAALHQAMITHEPLMMEWLDSPPQTNEVRRSGPLIAVAHWLTAAFDLPIVLSELGASMGLNLLWDQYALTAAGRTYGAADAAVMITPTWRGPAPPQARPVVAARGGVDLNPLDPVQDRLRLLSYIWADQPDRIIRTEAAMALAEQLRPKVVQGDAAEWAERRLAKPLPGYLHMVFSTVAWQYFPDDTRNRILAALNRAGAAATVQSPIAHVTIEADTGLRGARIAATVWPGGTTFELGRADFHGRWVDWQDPLA